MIPSLQNPLKSSINSKSYIIPLYLRLNLENINAHHIKINFHCYPYLNSIFPTIQNYLLNNHPIMGCINPKYSKSQVHLYPSMQVRPGQNTNISSSLSTVYSKSTSNLHLPKPDLHQSSSDQTPSSISIPKTEPLCPSQILSSESLIKSASSPQIPNKSKESESKSLKIPKTLKLNLKDETLNTENNLSQLLNTQSRFFYLSRSGYLNRKKLANGNYFINQYKIIGNLGKGSYGKVLKAVDENEQVFAIKTYNKRLLRTRWIGKSKNALDVVLDEIEILSGIDYKGVVKIVEVIEQIFYDKFYVVREFINGAPLNQRIPFSDRIREKFEKEVEKICELMKGQLGLKRDDVVVENFFIDDEDNLRFKGFASCLKIKEDLR